MKNILIIIDTLSGGGAERVLKDLLNSIDTSKYNIELLLINKIGVYLEEIEKKYKVMNLTKFEIKNRKNVLLSFFERVIRYTSVKFMSSSFILNSIIPHKYDIEVAFLEGRSTRILYKRKNNAKKISWIHTDLSKHRTMSKRNEFKAYSVMHKIVAVSNGSADSFRKLYPELVNKMEVIYNPIDVNLINIESKKYNALLDSNLINFVSVGRISYEKGYDILLEAHKNLMEKGYFHRIYILGEGILKDKIQKKIEKYGLQSSIKLLGYNKNPYPYMLKADIFLSSSRYEGFPLVLCEAIALGKPIIATKCTGSIEILDNGEYGLMVDVENIEDMQNKMKKMILEKSTREYYIKKSLERSGMFDIDSTIKRIENIFDNQV